MLFVFFCCSHMLLWQQLHYCLLRSLKFHNVDKIYTYLSPEIEYVNDCHIPYFISRDWASTCTSTGHSLITRFNFYRIKPLLDQFQGCCKDKYCSFAAYYMICRMVIIVVANSSNDDNTHHLLIIANAIFSTIHLLLRPQAIAFTIIILPLLMFAVMELIIHKTCTNKEDC